MIDESFVAAIAFGLFVLFAYKKIAVAMVALLDGRALKVERELAEALKMREDAQAMLGEYEKKYRSIEKESEEILRNAHLKVEVMRQEAEIKLKDAIESRLKAANLKIKRAEEIAVQDVQRQVVEIALMAARELIKEKMSNEADDQLINIAMQDVRKIIH